MVEKTAAFKTAQALYADLVMEGGGVKGIGLIGAVEVLHKQGYRFPRIAGASGGAIVGALLAAGMSPMEIRRLMMRLDFTQFCDPTFLSRFGSAGKVASLVFTRGIYKGDVLRDWLYERFALLGVRTFADLRITDEWASDLPRRQRYKLVVIVADIGRGRLLRLPWDYHLLGFDPDKQLVADAVRASASIPFFFQPVKINGTFFVDGGLLSNFPVDTFDTTPGPLAWPTFGIKLSSREDAHMVSNDTRGLLGFPLALLDTLINGYDQWHLNNPATTARTIFVDTGKMKATDFSVSAAQREVLHTSGREAAEHFLKAWDFDEYLRRYIKSRLAATALTRP